jgi:tetratricopeptide (TPR) repeat protein
MLPNSHQHERRTQENSGRKIASSFWLQAALVAALVAVYANYFQNGFHFDDFHTVTGNPSIRSLANVPRFFADPALFSTISDHQMYRPVTMVSLAVDYALGHGLNPFWFHLSTFLWLVVQVILMFHLFCYMMDLAWPDPTNSWTAFFAAAWYGLHPACAETVNYVIQRADLLSTTGIVAALWIFARYPHRRKLGLYLVPAVLAMFAKQPAVIFPAVIFAYVYFIEKPHGASAALKASVPAVMATVVCAAVLVAKTPVSFNAGATSAAMYRITQPYVAIHYFKSFFLPTELSADTDWGYVPGYLSLQAVIGYLFMAALIWTIHRARRLQGGGPIAFGLAWFILGLLPTSLIPLAEVMNDHRMFLPFVGLSLAVVWTARLALSRKTVRIPKAVVAGAVMVLAAYGAGTHNRNLVWRDEESLWRDVTEKSPNNGRGLMNYGLIFMARGEYATAISYYERALRFTPNYWALETNLAVAYGGIHRNEDADRHFLRAISLGPNYSDPHYFYARWLDGVGRTGEGIDQLQAALRINPAALDARHLLMSIYARQRATSAALNALAQETLRLVPDDAEARRILANIDRAVPSDGADELLAQSYQLYQSGQYQQSAIVAKKALEARPEYAEAYNNMAAAYNAMHRWNDGIWAATQAVRIKPDFALAGNNLAWAISQKNKAASK